jgi:hypothetical protein
MEIDVTDINCRVAKVEQRLDGLVRELNTNHDDNRRQTDRIMDAIDALKKDNDKNKGFFGGLTFAISGIFAFIVYVTSGKHF